MLYPQSNSFRQVVDLSGFWDLRFDPQGEGRTGWTSGFSGGRPAAVPASWNDQFEEWRDYLGDTWYQTRFDLPWGWDANQQRIRLRFGSVNYLAEVWLNGVRLGTHEGGHLPFEFEINEAVRQEGNLLVVCVNGELAPDRVPPGNIPPRPPDAFESSSFPAGSFDFYPFCGIHRPVHIYATPRESINDLTVVTEIAGQNGRVHLRVEHGDATGVSVRAALRDTGITAEAASSGGSADLILDVPDAHFWSPDSPYLYDLDVELVQNGSVVDRYSLPIGIRTIAIEGDQLLLNGQPIYLRGFGRHEDFPITGRGLLPAVIVKDYALMKWIGANSFRTTHYPYSEEMMMLADRLGFLVIDETPAVGLFFAEEGLDRRLALCRQYTQELIARDKNHPSVIMWSLANEPHSRRPAAKPFFRELYDLARELDPTRPITIVSYTGVDEESFEFVDIMCLNRYFGWYTQQGQLDVALPRLSEELDALYQKYRKPLIMTEFGTDTIPGFHAQPPEMFSEEYQAEFLTRYIELFQTKPYMVGEHIWNFCDFKTGQAVHRMAGMNHKGVFTRDRRPKLAAHQVRELWR
ncbi:MAG TPA: beta-glucuronidase [Oceanobacillus sp.]|nr:beta-glucuronidase [Oceanobacillus sp.]